MDTMRYLTQEETERYPKYLDKWMKIALSNELCDRKVAEKWLQEVYTINGHQPPRFVIWVNNPLEACKAQIAYENNESFILGSDMDSSGLSMFITQKIASETFSESSLREARENMYYGCYESPWLSFYDYFIAEFDYTPIKDIIPIMEMSKEVGWWSPFKDVCIMQEKPLSIHYIEDSLHREDGPAIEFRGDPKANAYFINNVRVPEWVVMTKPEDLDVNLIFAESYDGFSATHEIRSEIIKKIGAKRVMKGINATLIERKTGEEMWRQYPIADYVQQGDVLIFPGRLDEKAMKRDGMSIEKLEAIEKESGPEERMKAQEKYMVDVHRESKVTYETLDPATRIRLVNGVYYELYTCELQGSGVKILRMGNPSVFGEEHAEFIHKDCKNIFESIIFRNYGGVNDWESLVASLPKNRNIGLPCKLS
jgi:hypothetical protein